MSVYFYTYTIRFEDGYYYHGKRTSKIEPESDVLYVGSPKTNQNKWKTTKFVKIIEKICTTKEELNIEERLLIGNKHKTDAFCLNRSNITTFNAHGSEWYTNGISEMYVCEHTIVPDGWYKGRKSDIKEMLCKPKELGRRWITNEKIQKLVDDINFIPDGWREGTVPQVLSEEVSILKGQKISKKLKNKKKTASHVDNMKKTKQAMSQWYSENNVMRDELVKETHKRIMESDEVRDKISTRTKEGIARAKSMLSNKEKEERRERLSDSLKGAANPNSKRVTIDGCEYVSVSEAMKKTGLSRKKVLTYIRPADTIST
jgi:hypothetical protein